MDNIKLKYYKISDEICDRLEKILDQLKKNKLGYDLDSKSRINSRKAFQTDQLFTVQMEPIFNQIISEIGLTEYVIHDAFHMIDYKKGGYQKGHDHSVSLCEYSYVLYLTSCSQGGETVFKKGCLKIEVPPEKGTLVLFSREEFHYGRPTKDKKKVAVGSFKLKDERLDLFSII
jgi:hypothetical protein